MVAILQIDPDWISLSMQPTSGSSIFYFQVDLGNSQLYWLFSIYTKKLSLVHFMYGGKTNHDVSHFAAGSCEENVYPWILWIYVTVGIICKVNVRYLSVIISSHSHWDISQFFQYANVIDIKFPQLTLSCQKIIILTWSVMKYIYLVLRFIRWYIYQYLHTLAIMIIYHSDLAIYVFLASQLTFSYRIKW